MANSSMMGRPGRRPFSISPRQRIACTLSQVRHDAERLAATCRDMAGAIAGDGAATLARIVGALTAAAAEAEALRRAIADPCAAWMDEGVEAGGNG